jgi:hypothetical protein
MLWLEKNILPKNGNNIDNFVAIVTKKNSKIMHKNRNIYYQKAALCIFSENWSKKPKIILITLTPAT